MNSYILLTKDQQQWIALAGFTLALLHGGSELLAPRKHFDSYLTEKHSFNDEAKEEHIMSIMRQGGLACMTNPTIWFLMTVKNVPMEEAVGVTTFFWLLLMIAFLLNEVPQRVGNSLKGTYTNIAVFGFVTYATIMETKYANLSVKILAAFGLAHSLTLLLAPNFHALMWGNLTWNDDDVLHFVRRCAGCDLFAVAVYLTALACDVPNPKAAGISWAAIFFAFLTLLGGFKKFKFDMIMIYGWIVCMAFFAVTETIEEDINEAVQEGIKEAVQD